MRKNLSTPYCTSRSGISRVARSSVRSSATVDRVQRWFRQRQYELPKTYRQLYEVAKATTHSTFVPAPLSFLCLLCKQLTHASFFGTLLCLLCLLLLLLFGLPLPKWTQFARISVRTPTIMQGATLAVANLAWLWRSMDGVLVIWLLFRKTSALMLCGFVVDILVTMLNHSS